MENQFSRSLCDNCTDPSDDESRIDNDGPEAALHLQDALPPNHVPEDPADVLYPDAASCDTSSTRPMMRMESPNFAQFRLLTWSLLLTTLLAVGSAFDARNQCINEEMYTWLYFEDGEEMDEYSSQEKRAECLRMFRVVIFPVGGVTYVFGFLALFIIRRHLQYMETTAETFVPSHIPTLLQLFGVLVVIFVFWTYSIFSIMLKPKFDPYGYQQNPFISLAAVDQMGHIGENANLYYLSWMSEALIMVLVYQVFVDCIRRFGRAGGGGCELQQIKDARSFSEAITLHEHIQKVLSYTSARRLASHYRERQKTWYQFMVHLRERSGYWVAAFLASVVLSSSSAYLYTQVLVSLADQMSGGSSFRYREVCSIIKGNGKLPEEFCFRTSVAVIAGFVATCLCTVAVILHVLMRRKAAEAEDSYHCSVMDTQVLPRSLDPEKNRVHLGTEFFLSFCLSILLGINAVFATGAQGPAATVGNLYYASWLSFLLCLRICLGCLEEIFQTRKAAHRETRKSTETLAAASSFSGSEISFDMDQYTKAVKKERPSRLRKYFFLSIFSSVCVASAWDAAYNQESDCSPEQKYVIIAPAVVAFLSIAMFLLCLKTTTYHQASHICVGGIMSIVCFLLWLVDLIITMHSDDSWAVNSIGEMKLANLYYFSWASILTAALQMISYFKPFCGSQAKDGMILVWGGIVKVCFVILGAAAHVWHSISGTCGQKDTTAVELSFCSRTTFAMGVAVTGVLSGWLVIGSRIFCCSMSRQTRSRAEAVLSVLLVLLFGTALAQITSIGGPGQTVGDLYYATWLAFWVCIGIYVSCYDQIKQEEIERVAAQYENEDVAAYVDFEMNRADQNDRVIT